MANPLRSAPSARSIALVVPSLVGGGAERIAIDLANHLVHAGHQVSLLAIDMWREPSYHLDPRITALGLGLQRDSATVFWALWSNVVRLKALRRAIRRSGAGQVVSFTDVTNVTTLLSCGGLGCDLVVCERTDPRQQRLSRSWTWLRRRLYPRARALVVQTAAVAQWARSQGWRMPVYVLPNAAPNLLDEPAAHSPREPPRPSLLALGRLSREKGMDLLLAAFAQVSAEYPQWRLRLVGDGPERDSLTALAARLGVAERVCLVGWSKTPFAELRQADLFVLPSRYEGFPNALLEAMASGLPCIAFDCDSGPREIIRDGVDGVLVPAADVAALAEALRKLMSNASRREQLSLAARQVTQRFSRTLYFRRWDAILRGVTAQDYDALSNSTG